MQSDAP
ncbi:hypothetical protein E2C01_050941 [Portunus trituberculatus]|nr:hypothetical protein [Portunus trituberculatus]